MSSFLKEPSARRKCFLGLSGSIESQLRDAYAERHHEHGETQAGLAKKLDVSKSLVCRRLLGHTNMTIESIADLAWALGYVPRFTLEDATKIKSNSSFMCDYVTGSSLIKGKVSTSNQVAPVLTGSKSRGLLGSKVSVMEAAP